MRILIVILLVAAAPLARAEVIECNNGDRYHGTILSMDEKAVKLKNDIVGTITIPRDRVVGIQLGQAAVQKPATAPAATNRPAQNPARLQFDPAEVERIQGEYLSQATPEANQIFQELVRGLESGQLQVGDVQSQAATTLKQLKEAQKELANSELSDVLDGYAEVLEGFLKQAPANPRPPATTPSARSRPGVR